MDVILFDEMSHAKELNDDLSFNDAIDKESKAEIVNIIKQYWDCFAKEGAVRPILGYEFGIDTGG